MEIKILAFGQIAELVGASELLVADLEDTDALKVWLVNNHPAIQNMAFAISVNKKKVVENTALSQHSVVALLPPFSGG